MITVAGESLIDLVPQNAAAPGEPLPALLPRLGGGPYNTAVALGRLGARVGFCSRVSTDGFGEALLGGLRAAGVDLSLVQRGPEPTTLAVAALSDDGSAGYGFYAEGSADRLFQLPEQLPAEVRALSLGTCSLVLEPGASAYEALLRRESARGVFTLLDPNIRAGLIQDGDAYRKRFRGWLPDVTLLKLSEEDAQWLGGTPEEWLAAGPQAVVVTHGGDGLTVRTRAGGEYAVPGAAVDVVDTIGAGDTVNAALLHSLAERDALSAAATGALSGDDWAQVLGFAARAAAVTCSRTGAQPPYARELT
ncbi:carbohydrate kinase [Streptomyces sp. NPDC090052]|uniref:carbohydrate kinase family protein n=1 Tax=unclassified Streptomyces TaxID=2593676 RepID=UPI0022536602|nr:MULTISPECIES: carbohydrate kinase [unclassified Streptomyces]MCX4727262.1 carbohydrate kinase [Streptomyces sp. NBC_01306]WSV03493.1 carbohydrate kinase [Streptomyces sp. NBC_01020]WSX41527.1 carbohydrate kinase [Streptomyces sp. NBC_00963]WSX70502.1 carbohydrate kinase [Streptomyces sp. NBC_00932]